MYHPKIIGSLNQDEENYAEIKALPLFICYDVLNKLPISLEQVNYFVNVQPGLSIVEIQQVYNTQHYEVPIELEYMFTIQKDCAVSKMVVELGDLKVLGLVKELEEAKKEYEQGIQDGKTMVIGQQSQRMADLKKVKIGSLAPGKSLKITFEYIEPLKVYLNQFWKLELSPMVDSSYLAAYQLKNQQFNYPQLYKQIQQSVDLQGVQQNYRQNITISINFEKPITFAQSPTHKIVINNDDNYFVKEKQAKSQVIILDNKYQDNFAPNKKFELLFSSNDINEPHSFLTHTNNDALQHIKYCATFTLIPKFNEVPLDDAYSSYINGLDLSSHTKTNRGNYYFFIDRSGSMDGQRVKKAKQSLALFLQSLPEDCLFNVISFGSQFQPMFDKPQEYNQQSLNKAIQLVNNMEADLGGTDIYEALNNGFYKDQDSKSPLETFNAILLTDGEDSPQRILNLVQNSSKPNFRIYTLGIGDGCNKYLLKRIAEIGNGKCHFVADNEDINVKVIDLLEDSLTQYLEGFKLDLPEGKISQIIPDPEQITSIKKNEELIIQVLFPTPIQQILEFEIKCFDPQTQQQISYSYKLKINESFQQDYFHKLAAHKLINYYENSLQNNLQQVNKIKVNQVILNNEDIINLSIQNQILCTKTAYICEVCHLEDQFKQLIKEKIPFKNQEKVNNQMQFEEELSDRCCAMMDDECEMQECEMEDCEMLKCEMKDCEMLKCEMAVDCCVMDQYDVCDEQLCMKECQIIKKEINENSIPQMSQIIQKSQEAEDFINYMDLLQYFQANGSCILGKRITDSIKLSSLNNYSNYAEILWTTIVALFYLELHFQKDKASWQLVYQKAILYLKKNGLDYFKIKTQHYDNYQQLFEVSK